MIQDESESVIVVMCRSSLVGDVIRHLRATDDHAAAMMPASELAGDAQSAGTSKQTMPPEPSMASGDAVRAAYWLRGQHGLTEMQTVAVALRFHGWTNAEIACAMSVEVGTVKRHIHDGLRRIGAGAGVRIDALFRRTLRQIPPLFVVDADALAVLPWHQWFTRALRRAASKPDDARPKLHVEVQSGDEGRPHASRSSSPSTPSGEGR